MPAAEGPAPAVAFLGLGRMGLPMAARLVAAGIELRSFDREPAVREAFAARTGGACAESAAAAAAGAATVVLMLPNSEVVEQVVLREGVLDSAAPGALLVDMGSSAPLRTRALAATAGEHGRRLLDAPVSGGVVGAEAGSLTIMVGGEAADLEHCRPLLELLGASVVHVGGVGAGHALKAINNLLVGVTLLASSEALAIGRRFGLDPRTLVEVVNRSTGRSWSTEHKLPEHVLSGAYASGFALDLLVKDMRTAVELAAAIAAPAALAEAATALWAEAAGALPPGADHTEIARWTGAGEPSQPNS
jgi:3-hydroxyisobutyrate dehydrogenase